MLGAFDASGGYNLLNIILQCQVNLNEIKTWPELDLKLGGFWVQPDLLLSKDIIAAPSFQIPKHSKAKKRHLEEAAFNYTTDSVRASAERDRLVQDHALSMAKPASPDAGGAE